ncbi:hypothetical protein Tco_0815970 [Tanacetum coccineum]
MDMDTELVEGSEVDEDKETSELQRLIEVVPDKEEVAIDAIPLTTKPPSIVDYKIHKEGKKTYYQIIGLRNDQAEEGPTNFALMAYSSTSSDSKVSTNSNCSSSCLENVKILKEQNEQLLKDLRTSKLNVIAYKTGLESVEARLLVYKKNESVYEEDIKVLKCEIHLREVAITELRRKLELAQKQKDEIQLTIVIAYWLKDYKAGTELEQESIKKKKLDEDKETFELQRLIEVIPDKEEVAIDAIPLATKPPSIVDYKIHKEGKKTYYQIIRVDGSSKMSEEGYERVLWGDLKTMFHPHIEDQVWRNQQDYKVLDWKIYDSCGVHSLRMQHKHIHMLVEKRYPLTPTIITDMLNKKL